MQNHGNGNGHTDFSLTSIVVAFPKKYCSVFSMLVVQGRM